MLFLNAAPTLRALPSSGELKCTYENKTNQKKKTIIKKDMSKFIFGIAN